MDCGNDVKDCVRHWLDAMDAHTSGRYTDAIEAYRRTDGRSARMLYNTACAHIRLGDTKSALKCLDQATLRDENLAIAYFQRGVLHLQASRTKEAIFDFEMAQMILRGNRFINYRPLGLLCELHSCEVLYNLALGYYHDNDLEEAEHVLMEAFHDSEDYDAYRNKITAAITAIKEGRPLSLKPFTICPDKLFVPPKSVSENLDCKQKKGKSTLVFSTCENDTPAFRGCQRVEQLKDSRKGKNKHDGTKNLHRTHSLSDVTLNAEKSSRYLNVDQPSLRKRSFSASDVSSLENGKSNKFFPKALRKSIKKVKRSSMKLLQFRSMSALGSKLGAKRQTFAKSKSAGRLGALNTDKLDESIHSIKESDEDYINVWELAEKQGQDGCGTRGEKATQSDKKGVSASTLLSGFSGNQKAPSKPLNLTRMIKSAGDMKSTKVVLPLEKKKTDTSSKSFSKILPKGLRRNKKQKDVGQLKTLMMDGFHSSAVLMSTIADFGQNDAVDKDNDTSDEHDISGVHISCPTIQIDACPDDCMKEEVKSEDKPDIDRKLETIGDVFGDKSTVINFALTNACDVATAVATPTSDKGKPTGKQRHMRQHGKIMFQKRTAPRTIVNGKRKKKRAPDPPAELANTLFQTCKMFSAFVYADLDDNRNATDDTYSDLECSTGGSRKESETSAIEIERRTEPVNQDVIDQFDPLEESIYSDPECLSEVSDDEPCPLEISYLSADGSLCTLSKAKSPPPSYSPPPLPPTVLAAKVRMEFEGMSVNGDRKGSPISEDWFSNAIMSNDSGKMCSSFLEEDENGYAVMNSFEGKKNESPETNSDKAVLDDDNKIIKDVKVHFNDSPEYINLPLHRKSTLRNQPPAYPPPPLRPKYSKSGKKKSDEDCPNLKGLLGQTIGLAAAFAGINLASQPKSAMKKEQSDYNNNSNNNNTTEAATVVKGQKLEDNGFPVESESNKETEVKMYSPFYIPLD